MRVWRRILLLGAIIAAAVVLGMAVGASLAAFSATTSNGANSFSAAP